MLQRKPDGSGHDVLDRRIQGDAVNSSGVPAENGYGTAAARRWTGDGLELSRLSEILMLSTAH